MKFGEYSKRAITDKDLWAAFSNFYSSRSRMNTTYKYILFKSILDNLYNTDPATLILPFKELFTTFVKINWNLVGQYKLRQQVRSLKTSNVDDGEKQSGLERIIYDTVAEYHLMSNIPFDSIPQEAKDKVVQEASKKCSKHVLGSLYGDTLEILYSFCTQVGKEDGWIKINPLAYPFLCRNKLILEKLNYFEWAKFLEKINSDEVVDKVLAKLDASTFRKDLSFYRNILYEEFEQHRCFYCNRPLDPAVSAKIHVDHFIPWSFIKDDKIWNFVLACPACNSSKSDKLPVKDYLDRLNQRNADILHKLNQDQDNDHIIILDKVNIRVKQELTTYNNDLLGHIYDYANENGYTDIWRPKTRILC